MGAYALGMRNLLCLTGDHQSFGNHPHAKNVHDLDSVSLIQAVVQMRDPQSKGKCRGQLEQHVQQHNGVRSSGDTHQDGVVRRNHDELGNRLPHRR